MWNWIADEAFELGYTFCEHIGISPYRKWLIKEDEL